MRRSSVLFILQVVLFSTFIADAQVATGIYQLETADNKGFDSVNIANLNAHFSIPVFSKPGRGGTGFYYNLVYDSAIWTPVTSGSTITWQPATTWGWTSDTDAVTGYFTYSTLQKKCFDTPPGWYWTTYSWNFNYVDQFGGTHNFPGATSDCSSYGSDEITVTAKDGSGLTLTAGISAFSIKTPSGQTIQPPVNASGGIGLLTDANGNQIATSSSGITDTTGATALSISGTGTPTSPRVFTYPVWLSPTSPTTTEPVTINYQNYSILTAFGCNGITEYSAPSVSLVSSIALADGEQYSFTYEQINGQYTGRLLTITLPTGGVITYSYTGGSHGIVCADGGAATLTRSITLPAGTSWTYTRTPGSTGRTTHTDVVDGLSNHAAYDFVADIVDDPTHKYYVTNQSQNQGVSTQLLAATTCYNGATAPCTTQALTLPITSAATNTSLNGTNTKSTKLTFNSYGLLTEEDDFDFGTSGPGPQIRSIQIGYAVLSNGIVNQPADIITWDGSSHELGGADYRYDETSVQTTSGLPHHVPVTGARGNLTSVSLINPLPGSPVVSHFTYDDAGQRLTSSDPKGNATTYAYDSGTDTFLTQVTFPTVNGATQHLNGTYDIASGAMKSSTDQNTNTTNYTYDPVLRPASIGYPDGGSSTWTYSLTRSSPYMSIATLHASGSNITQTSHLDAYMRLAESESTDSPHDDLTDYSYDKNGNMYSVSNPYRSGDTPVYTYYAYDGMNRVTNVTKADNSVFGLTYLGNATTLADEVSHKRKIVSDGIGRVASVFAPDSSGSLTLETDYLYSQNYTYGSSGQTYQNIVQQKGGSTNSGLWRTRTLTYDLPGRLLQETIPEAGTTTYAYLNGSSYCSGISNAPCTRTDANGTVTTYGYDALSRLTGKSYGGTPIGTGTPAISYLYDQASYNGLTIINGKGQQTGMTDGSGATAWSFDSMGRPVATRKTLNSVTTQANYTYNLDGTAKTIQDFAGNTFTYSYDVAGRQTGVADGAGNTYASGAVYNAANLLTSLTHQKTSTGTAYTRAVQYNTRLQPNSIQVTAPSSTILSLTYGYGAASMDNGTIQSISNGLNSSRSQSFSYDNLNRLTSAQTGAWGNTYVFDNWDNLLQKNAISGHTGESLSVLVNANNQISGVTGLSYDSAGNMKGDNLGNIYTYDAEGRILTVNGASYVYDGSGYRVKKTVSGTTTLYWPGATGKTLDETNGNFTSTGRQVYINGLMVWHEDTAGTGLFLFQDHLASARVTADASGNRKDDIDYYPFGAKVANYGPAPSDNHYEFTGYETDTESTSSYGVFRNLSWSLGRYNRADPFDGSYNVSNPRSLNRYGYVLDSPIEYVDPLGLASNCAEDEDPAFCISSPLEPGVPTWVGTGGGGSRGPNKRGTCPSYISNFFNTLTPVFQDMADEAGTNANFFAALSAYESGWFGQHAQDLQNPFGLTKAGGNDLSFNSYWKAADYWMYQAGRNKMGYEGVVAGAGSITDFAEALQNAGYNNKTGTWTSDVISQLDSVQKWMGICKVRF